VRDTLIALRLGVDARQIRAVTTQRQAARAMIDGASASHFPKTMPGAAGGR
jgi:hypothetical protein